VAFDALYLSKVANETTLEPGANEILVYLQSKGYTMHIITNGFNEIQYQKLSNSGISGFFKEVITSEAAGALKPSPVFFKYALTKCNAQVSESLVIGDDYEADINGALLMGLDTAFYTKTNDLNGVDTTFKISNLLQLKAIL